MLGESPVSSSKESSLNGFARKSGLPPVSDQSFHPNRAGHEAYAAIFARRVLGNPDHGIAVTFDTYACTGALTENVHEPADPEGLSVLERHNVTNRPSPHTDVRDIELDSHGEVTSITVPAHWEPRQAVSLAQARQRLQAQGRDIDMVTITIGGNDAGFGDVVAACVTPVLGNLDSTCDEEDLVLSWREVQDRLEEVLERVRAAAPRASVFVLGYAPITPRPTPCAAGERECPELGLNSFIDECTALSAQEILAHTADLDSIPAVLQPLGYLAKLSPLGIGADVTGLTLDQVLEGIAKIDHVEANFLWSSSLTLNRAVREAASAIGTHFVDISGQDPFASSLESFVGHDPCSTVPWLNGFVLDASKTPARSENSIHPNVAGHEAYMRILEQYIRAQYAAGVELTEAGLPVNPRSSRQ